VDSQANAESNASGKLNVLFHGAFTFNQSAEPNRILVMMPLMEHHVYRAGNWLAETELRGRTGSKAVIYELSGVKPGEARIRPEDHLNLMVKTKPQIQPEIFPHATLRLPLPETITSLRVAELPRGAFSHPEELVLDDDPQHITTLQVFTYDIKDEDTLSLKARDGEGHYWEPVFVDNYVNLHVFAAEDHFHKPSNALEDFNVCAGLLGGVKLKLQVRTLRDTGIDQRDLPNGITDEETESLASRTLRMARLGRLLKQKGDANLAWYGNDALDGSEGACAGPTG
jgi:hypothetical protein